MKTSILCTIMILMSSVIFAATFTVDFNNQSDLNSWFTGDGDPICVNQSEGGINNSGCVNIPTGTNDIWTAKYMFSVPSEGEEAILSGYFLIAENGGYSGYGLSVADQNESSSGDCHVSNASNIGVQFHGGGGAFFNNSTEYPLDWFGDAGDLIYEPDTWYFFRFTITGLGSNQFFLELDIYRSNLSGSMVALHTHQEQTVTNTEVANAEVLYAYFAAGGNRSIAFDNYTVEATEITSPVTMSSFTATTTSMNYAQINWTTQSESDLVGYHILRGETSELDAAQTITASIIPGTNTSTEARYEYLDRDVEMDATYFYWLQSVELDGGNELFGPVSVTIAEGVEQDDTPDVSFVTAFSSVYPNPFNPMTTIRYSLEKDGMATFTMFDLKGRKVGEMTECGHEGNNTLTWNAEDLPSGLYFIRMNTDGLQETRKVMLLK